MKETATKIYKKITARDTWEKTLYFMRGKDPSELKRQITKDDIVPIVLSIVIYVGAVVIAMYFFKTIGCWLKR